MDEDVTGLALHSQEPKIIFHGSGECGAHGDEIVVELQETVFVEGEEVAMHTFASEELVIQDAVEDVVTEYVHCTEEELEEVAVETCVMSLEGAEEDGLQVDVVPEEVLVTGGHTQDDIDPEQDQEACGDYLMISLDEADKGVHGSGAEVRVEGVVEDQEKEDDGQEVIKVYIFKADPGEDDLGGRVDIGEDEMDVGGLMDPTGRSVREKMVYMSVGDAHHDQNQLGVAKMADEVYMEVVVGGEEAHSATLGKDFMPVAWAAAYAGADESEACENRNGAASALLHIDESCVRDLGVVGKISRQHSRNKSRKRTETRQVQTAIIIGPYGQPLTVYPCAICGKKFKSRGFLKRHTKNHHQEVLNRKKYQCTDCDFTTNKKASLHDHMEVHTLSSKASLECEECGKEFHQQAALYAHRLQHRDAKGQATPPATPPATKMHKCKFCDYETAEQGLLNRHLLAVHSKNFPHICVECGKGFRHPSELKKHMRTHTGEKPYGCLYCDYKSADSSNLKTHVKTKHSKEMPYKCERCFQTFSEAEELLQHALTHDETKSHQCAHCEHKSSNSSDLKRHVISVHTKEYPHKCGACGKGFHRPSELKKHAVSHRARKLHQCRHCSFKIADPFVLSRHILSVHTKEQQPFADRRGKRTFGGVGGKRGGAKAQRERRVYQCQYCDYTTGDASGFKRHVISIHTKDYPHRCQFCDKGFRRPSEKNQHILRHHKDLAQNQ